MNAERNVISTEAMVFSKDTVVSARFRKLRGVLIIKGDLIVNDALKFNGTLYVSGNILCELSKNICITGDLYCYGLIDCYDITVNGSIYCNAINSSKIKVAENLICKTDIDANNAKVIVAGNLECSSIAAGQIYVLEGMKVKTDISAETVEVGY